MAASLTFCNKRYRWRGHNLDGVGEVFAKASDGEGLGGAVEHGNRAAQDGRRQIAGTKVCCPAVRTVRHAVLACAPL